MSAQRRDHEGLRERNGLVELGGKLEKFRRLHPVNLVQDKHFCCSDLRQPFKNGPGLAVSAFVSIDKQGGGVGVARIAPGGSDHGPVKPAFRREDTRRINENNLRSTFQRNAAHSNPRSLNLAGDDRDLCSDEPVDERRFSGIRCADDGHKAAAYLRSLFAVHTKPFCPAGSFPWSILSRAINAAAAACSASRLAKPLASACA